MKLCKMNLKIEEKNEQSLEVENVQPDYSWVAGRPEGYFLLTRKGDNYVISDFETSKNALIK